MAKYDFGLLNEEQQCVLLAAIGGLSEGKFHEVIKPPIVDIVLTVEGVEIDFMEFCMGFFSQIDSMVADEAQDLIHEKMANIYGHLNDIEQYVAEKARQELSWKED